MSNLDPMPVTIVRPNRTPGYAFGALIGHIGAVFLKAWILMLVLGALHTQVEQVPPLGYWYTMLVVIGVWCLRASTLGPSAWSRASNDKNVK